MIAAVDWANLTVAGAFIVGAMFGTVATIAVLRSLVAVPAAIRLPRPHDRGAERDDDERAGDDERERPD